MIEIINTSQDNYSEGFAKSMKPFYVKKQKKDQYLLGNVNLSSAIIDDKTILGNAKIPRKVVNVQYVIVKGNGFSGRFGHHGQLRFIFGESIKTDTGDYDDLIISFEGWRSAGTKLDLEKSLKNDFLITARAYVGPQRWLKDELRGFHWRVFNLRLNDYNNFFDHTIQKCQELTAATINDFNKSGELYKEYTNFFVKKPLKQKVYFNLVNNNCAINSIMLLSSFLGGEQALELNKAITKLPDFMKQDKVKTKGNLHKILFWLIKNNKIIPSRTYKYLKNAGLISTKLSKSESEIYK